MEIKVPDGIKKLRAKRFKNKKYLSKLILPESITEIEESVFEGCENLQEIRLPEGITKIPARAFKGCKNLNKLILPKIITEIEEGAFEGCESLQEISLPEEVIEIPDRAFKGCKNLSKINLNKVEKIDNTAFEGCNSLYYDNVTGNNEELKKMFDKIARVPRDLSLIDNEFIEKLCNSEIIEIEHDDANDILSKIDEEIKAKLIKCTPQSLKILSKIANFERIFISEGVQEIDKTSFENCKDAKQVIIPDSITKIEQGTFDNCSNINFVKCPLRLLESFNKANLEHILLDEDEEIKDVNFTIFSGCKNLTTLSNAPDNWIEDENVTNKIFEMCPNLTLIISESNIQKIRPQYGEILDGVKNISKREYVNGDVLNKLVIPKTVESIEEGTFENCTKLKNVKADPKWLHRLPKWEIERLVVPDWVLEVHEKDFDCCYKLKELIFENDNTKLCGESCDAFENIESIKCSATTASSLSQNAKKNLKKLEIKEGTIEIGKELSDFYNLQKIALPETLRKIKGKGLSYCKNLKYIKIPDGVEIIEKDAFEGSKKLETVFCNLKLLKYLPKSQIKTIRLKDENIDIDNVIENDCKEYENLEKIIYNKDGKIVSYDIPKKKEDKKVEDVFENCDELEKNEEPTVVPVPKEEAKIEPQVGPTPSQKAETTTIEQLVEADPGNKKYGAYVEKIRKAIESGKYVNENTKDMSLEGISNSIINVCIKIDEKHKRKPYIVQILTILRLADEILNQYGDRKGAVAEVKTGEGKSFIIEVLAIVLALRERKVDIITSTTELAKRDEEDQRKYYELFEEKVGGEMSGVLYHEVGDRGYYDIGTKFENNFNVEVFNRSIVYSTGRNFEFAYLGELYTNRRIRGKREYDVAIVDEVDNMLLDQNSSPALSARGIEKVYAKDILTIVYYCQKEDESEILRKLNLYIPNNGIGIELVRKMKRAAQKAVLMNEGVEYIIENGREGRREITPINNCTGAKQQGTRWKDYLHEMVEIKEELPIRETTVSFAVVDNYVYFQGYKKITGLSGTMGDANEVNTIKGVYKVNVFKVPRNKKEKKTIKRLGRPENYQELINLVVRDCMEQRRKGRPVLVIFNYIYEAEGFVEALESRGIECGVVDGQNAKGSQGGVERAGEPGRITIGTIFAGRGTDIKINGQLEKIGGLHVIVVSRMLNQRVLEQAIGRSGRNGQQGSATIFRPELQGVGIAPFRDLYKNLDRLQRRFSEHIRENWGWLYEAEGGGLGSLKYPFNTEVEDIFELSSRMIAGTSFGEEDDKRFRNQLYDMVITSWGVFFDKIESDPDRYDRWDECEAAYNEYLGQLHYWLSPKAKTLEAERLLFGDAKLMRELANVNWADVACKGIIIAGGVAILCIPGANAVALAAASSAVISAGLEIQERLIRGEEINWGVVLTRAAGGALKGAVLCIPGAKAGALALVGATAGYTGIAGVENIVSAALRGEDLNLGVIGREIGNAAIEGASAGVAAWLCKNLAGKNASKAVGENLVGKLAGKKLPEISKLAAGKIAKLPELAKGKLAKIPELAKEKLNELAKIPEFAGERLSELASKRLPVPVGEAGFSRAFGGANIPKWKPPVEAPKPLLAKAKGSNLKPNLQQSKNIKIDYRQSFFEHYPEYKHLGSEIEIHHSIEQCVLDRFPGLFTEEEINDVKMLRGILKSEIGENGKRLHQSAIRTEWNRFYKQVKKVKYLKQKKHF